MCMMVQFLKQLSCTTLLFTVMIARANADITAHDAYGAVTFEQVPQRVVVLNWDILEQVLALDIEPIAAPNLPGYRQWVVNPYAPESIEDIGTRAEPSLEKIASLKPDVILAASPQQDLIPLLRQIAPVVYLPNFSQNEAAAQTAIKHFRTLGALFDKQELAEQKLAKLNDSFKQLRDKIRQHYSAPLDVLVMRFSTPNSVLLSTENSTTDYVVEQLGLTNPIQVSARAWGIKQDRINRLQNLEQSYVLYVQPFPQESKLNSSPLWQAMPFVKKQRVNSVRAVWAYGGAMSLQYMAEAITDSLIELAPKQ
ncbi:TPA: iron-siderophore ABC transporter substrate-binding protein [Vibrio parahaemolyticus]|uniref:iron-siderophore ABC transporter substrate-binding protein n=1 Tax=Vibrio parahaemolyticus TaxID=670 RepID=UPI00041CD4C9|nr:iron-siderophore ABC transporter substrate-binding protein [Vibrio parahaemolyticus]EGQ9887907.1 iron-siderophore ABC transporter substrate-binding protein [Vibrio parahaemolyticus]OKY50178.1 iron-hydroxamate ABC transporter substrate-binding protein [Vibrio parahaemolyticus]HCE2583017.1 iron-siderophore ABC transporter substrate-binding protein [Vibrio parahaemolyticus]HCE2728037.1 iron-siderophore ABC transporter substrate-binding protein [Vibrio parahaemolyticus]HCE2810906.1 iron-siderop